MANNQDRGGAMIGCAGAVLAAIILGVLTGLVPTYKPSVGVQPISPTVSMPRPTEVLVVPTIPPALQIQPTQPVAVVQPTTAPRAAPTSVPLTPTSAPTIAPAAPTQAQPTTAPNIPPPPQGCKATPHTDLGQGNHSFPGAVHVVELWRADRNSPWGDKLVTAVVEGDVSIINAGGGVWTYPAGCKATADREVVEGSRRTGSEVVTVDALRKAGMIK